MDATFNTPSIDFAHPRFTQPYMTSFEFYTSYNKANASYNCKSQKVQLLDFAGMTTLSVDLINPTINPIDNTNFGQAHFAASWSALKYHFGVIQNLGSHFFINAATHIIDQEYRNLRIIPINNTLQPLTQSEIDSQPEFKQYLDNLEHKINQSCHFSRKIGPTYATLGYTNNFQNLQHLDFFDITAQIGIWFSGYQAPAKTTSFNTDPNLIPNIGIPIQLNVAIGLYDWLNIGSCALVIPFITTTAIMPVSTNTNPLLINTVRSSTVKAEPMLYVNTYLEADQFIPYTTILAGVYYLKQHKICTDANTLKPWETITITLSADFDLAKKYQKVLPHIKLSYVCPVWGHNTFKTSAFAGSFGIDIVYEF